MNDEELARQLLRRMIETCPGFEVVGECRSGTDAAETLRNQTCDLVFLDVQMPDLDGFGVLSAVGPGRMPAVIFVTAFDQYALAAFEVNAVDYLLKPFDDERFEITLKRARELVLRWRVDDLGEQLYRLLETHREHVATAGQADTARPPRRRVPVMSGGDTTFVETDNIEWIEAQGVYALLHTRRGSHIEDRWQVMSVTAAVQLAGS